MTFAHILKKTAIQNELTGWTQNTGQKFNTTFRSCWRIRNPSGTTRVLLLKENHPRQTGVILYNWVKV
jgi:hypothetical protein